MASSESKETLVKNQVARVGSKRGLNDEAPAPSDAPKAKRPKVTFSAEQVKLINESFEHAACQAQKEPSDKPKEAVVFSFNEQLGFLERYMSIQPAAVATNSSHDPQPATELVNIDKLETLIGVSSDSEDTGSDSETGSGRDGTGSDAETSDDETNDAETSDDE